MLDGYFLSMERRFRALYEDVRKLDEAAIDFSMNTGPYQGEKRNSWLAAMRSRTLVVYYAGLAAVMTLLSIFIR